MKKIFSTILSASLLLLATPACCEIEDGTTDIDSWDMPLPKYDPVNYSFSHPCMLHSTADLQYVRDNMGAEPWATSYNKLLNTGLSNGRVAAPVKYLARLDANNWADGGGRWDDAGLRDEYYPGIHSNCSIFYQDMHAAYQMALKWSLKGDRAAAQNAVEILRDWAAVNQGLLLGRKKWKDEVIDPNEYLIMFQIHQAANAAELLRDYDNWASTAEFRNVCDWMTTYFYPFCSNFVKNNDANHYWMNWDMASMTAILSMGILTDNNDMVNEAILAFKQGRGPGCISGKGAPYVYEDPSGTGEMLAQGNEAGRDQGHNVLCAAMVGAFCQMANNIGEDLFAFNDYRAIAFAQYIAKINIVLPEIGKSYDKSTLTSASFKYKVNTIPFTTYDYCSTHMTSLGLDGRGEIRPTWDLWAGYCKSHDIKATYINEIAEHFRGDGGGGNYGGGSGGYDQLGFSTLMHYRK